MENRPGLRLGKYEVLKQIAKGGMAEIFLARVCGLRGLTRMVVLKRILPVLATNADFLEMFLNEARIAATLQHPNVVQMYDVGVSDGHYFIAMEYLHGENVRSIQTQFFRQDKPVPIEHAVHIMVDICAGLHYAHEKIGFDGQPLNIVHRDVSPQNVIVTFDGAVKLLDFGVAKASGNMHDTRNGVVKGKVPYMSPEQVRGRPLDRRSDLFAVGIMLYELTLGRRLFGGGTSELETLKRIAEQPVRPPRTLIPDYDERLERIVMRALAKNPDRRYQTARELQIDLEELAQKRGMYMSAIALQQFMSSVFGKRIEAWREEPRAPDPARETSVEIVIASDDEKTPVKEVPKLADVLSPPELLPRRRRWAVGLVAPLFALAVAPAALHRSPPPPEVPAAPLVSEEPAALASFAPDPLPPPEKPPEPPPPKVRRAPLEDSRLVLAAQPWCQVSVDGVPRGATPITLQVASGTHTVRLANPAFQIDSTSTVRVNRGQVLRKAFRFPTGTVSRR